MRTWSCFSVGRTDICCCVSSTSPTIYRRLHWFSVDRSKIADGILPHRSTLCNLRSFDQCHDVKCWDDLVYRSSPDLYGSLVLGGRPRRVLIFERSRRRVSVDADVTVSEWVTTDNGRQLSRTLWPASVFAARPPRCKYIPVTLGGVRGTDDRALGSTTWISAGSRHALRPVECRVNSSSVCA